MYGCRNRGDGDPLLSRKAEMRRVSVDEQAAIDKMRDEAAAAMRERAGYATMRVFFATDRNRIAPAGHPAFGASRGARLSLGTCEVSIPRDHRMGELESPSILRLEFHEDPERHVVLLRTTVMASARFYDDLAARVRQSGERSSFLFVHGYNVSFEDAARRTAQLAYDLGFDGPAVFYSWPSRGDAAAYTIDEQTIEWSQANLRAFLEHYTLHSGAQRIYLIAHSMGSRALTRALGAVLAAHPEIRNRLKEVILAAPDIDADVFSRDIAPTLARYGSPVTLYASSTDRALAVSRGIHGSPRAGDAGAGLVIARGIDTIDATGVDTSFIGHSYLKENRVLGDIHEMIAAGLAVDRRFGLDRRNTPKGPYWIFRRDDH